MVQIPKRFGVSKKSEKIAALIEAQRGLDLDAHYLGYFECFNRERYYEAHDVLEELWLAEGKTGANYGFYKGLIQLAGAFVHLQKNRLGPAVTLFNLAESYLRPYLVHHQRLDLNQVVILIQDWRGHVLNNRSEQNLLHQHSPPKLCLSHTGA